MWIVEYLVTGEIVAAVDAAAVVSVGQEEIQVQRFCETARHIYWANMLQSFLYHTFWKNKTFKTKIYIDLCA